MSTKADNLPARVAQAVKQRREQLRLTLRDLSARSGVSASTISDIERGAKSPTIATLDALAQAFGLPMSAFTDNATPSASRIHVVRAAERPRFVDTKSGAKRDSFGPTLPGSKVEFLSYVVPPRKVAGPFAAHAGGTIEHMHVAVGSIRAEFGNEAVTLEAGTLIAVVMSELGPGCVKRQGAEDAQNCFLALQPSTVTDRAVLSFFNLIETNVLLASPTSEFSHSLGH